MSEQVLKELGIELNKLELKGDDVLVIKYDLNKIKFETAGEWTKFIKEKIKNKVLVVPNENILKFFAYDKDDLLEFQKKI